MFSMHPLPRLIPAMARARALHQRYSGCSKPSGFLEDTIYALSSGPMLKTGVAVIRVSGPKAKHCLNSFLSPSCSFPQPREASLRRLWCPQTSEMLDRALVLWFPGPHSYTGEDVAELHVHGSKAVVDGIFSVLEDLNSSQPNGRNKGHRIRPADKGEFTKRAYYAGKMDLTEIEGVGDLLFADTSSQRKQALRQMEGHMRRLYEAWREELKHCLAHTEAVIDFGDDDREDHVNDEAMWVLTPRVRALHSEMSAYLNDSHKGELVREGIRVALVGRPNAGKSSLLNALARRPAAIVSPTAGTTRDVVEVRLDLDGVACLISDTAGLRETEGSSGECLGDVELEGMRRAREVFSSAHVRVFVVDASVHNHLEASKDMIQSLLASPAGELATDINRTIEGSEGLAVEMDGARGPLGRAYERTLIVHNKMDLVTCKKAVDEITRLIRDEHRGTEITDGPDQSLSSPLGLKGFALSCRTSIGMESFEKGLAKVVHDLVFPPICPTKTSSDGKSREINGGIGSALIDEGALITRQRHRDHIREAVMHLEVFVAKQNLPMDLAAEELRLAMRAIGKLTGTIEVEELLDIIFRDFCIGK